MIGDDRDRGSWGLAEIHGATIVKGFDLGSGKRVVVEANLVNLAGKFLVLTGATTNFFIISIINDYVRSRRHRR